MTTFIPSIVPDDTDSTILFCCVISLVSTKKSLSANDSDTLYGNVFLLKPEEFRSYDWLKGVKLDWIDFDLNWSPIKYGNVEIPALLIVAW